MEDKDVEVMEHGRGGVRGGVGGVRKEVEV